MTGLEELLAAQREGVAAEIKVLQALARHHEGEKVGQANPAQRPKGAVSAVRVVPDEDPAKGRDPHQADNKEVENEWEVEAPALRPWLGAVVELQGLEKVGCEAVEEVKQPECTGDGEGSRDGNVERDIARREPDVSLLPGTVEKQCNQDPNHSKDAKKCSDVGPMVWEAVGHVDAPSRPRKDVLPDRTKGRLPLEAQRSASIVEIDCSRPVDRESRVIARVESPDSHNSGVAGSRTEVGCIFAGAGGVEILYRDLARRICRASHGLHCRNAVRRSIFPEGTQLPAGRLEQSCHGLVVNRAKACLWVGKPVDILCDCGASSILSDDLSKQAGGLRDRQHDIFHYRWCDDGFPLILS